MARVASTLAYDVSTKRTRTGTEVHVGMTREAAVLLLDLLNDELENGHYGPKSDQAVLAEGLFDAINQACG